MKADDYITQNLPFYHITKIDETEFRNAFQDQLNKIRTEFNNLEFEHEDIKI
jgi:hypothetical protein